MRLVLRNLRRKRAMQARIAKLSNNRSIEDFLSLTVTESKTKSLPPRETGSGLSAARVARLEL